MQRPPGEPDRREALFGGSGEVLVWNLGHAEPLAPFTAVLGCELAAGGRVGAHRQERDAEIVIFTSGEGTAEVNGVSRAVGPGAVVALPFGASLALAASSAAPLKYLIVKATPG